MEVAVKTKIYHRDVAVSASLIPGTTPLLRARPVLEEWKVIQIQNFASGKIKLLDTDQWITPVRASNGHFLLQLVDPEGDQVLLQDTPEEIYAETPLGRKQQDGGGGRGERDPGGNSKRRGGELQSGQ